MISSEQLERWREVIDALPEWKRASDGGLIGPPQEFGPPLSDEELCEMFEIGTVTAFAREAVPALIAEVERLRAALTSASAKPCEIVFWTKSSHPCQEFYPRRDELWCASCIARAALKETP